MVYPYTEVPKEFVVLIFQYALRDVIVPFIIPVEPAFSWQTQYPGHIIIPFLYSFCVNFEQPLTMWLTVLFLSLHILHLASIWDLWVVALMLFVRIAWSCAAITSSSVSLLRLPCFSQLHVSSLLWLSVSPTNCPYSGFSFHYWVFSALRLTLKLVAVFWLAVTSSLTAFYC